MKTEILKALKKLGGRGISFVELEREIPTMKGDFALLAGTRDEQTNTCLWFDVSSEFIDAFSEMARDESVEVRQTEPLVYMIDGKVPKLPVAASAKRTYKTPHWLPVSISLPRA